MHAMRTHHAVGVRQRVVKAACDVGSGKALKRAAARWGFGVDDCTSMKTRAIHRTSDPVSKMKARFVGNQDRSGNCEDRKYNSELLGGSTPVAMQVFATLAEAGLFGRIFRPQRTAVIGGESERVKRGRQGICRFS